MNCRELVKVEDKKELDLFHVIKTAGKNKQYSENDKILKTRKMAILQKAIAWQNGPT